MIRAVLICAFAAYASTVSAAPVLAPHAGDGLDARLAQLEAKVKALEVGVDTDAKKVSENYYEYESYEPSGGHICGAYERCGVHDACKLGPDHPWACASGKYMCEKGTSGGICYECTSPPCEEELPRNFG